MKTLLLAYDATGKEITAVSYYLLLFVMTLFLDVVGMARLLRGFSTAASFYFFLSMLCLFFFLYVSDALRERLPQKIYDKAGLMMVAGFILGLTALFFLDGGLRGGSFLFFLIAFVATPLFLRPKPALAMMCAEATACGMNILLSLRYPASVHGEDYTTFDALLPFLLVGLCLGAMCLLYTVAYRRQQKHLTVALHTAQSANEAKASFLDNMSHEIRTPMNTILGMNEMILREEQRPEIREYASQIQRSGLALLSVINDILDYSKIQDKKMQITPIRYDLSSLINDMVNIAADAARRKSLEFHVYTDREIPRVLSGDEFHIRQVILNIINNAVKYTARGGVTFRVGFEKEDEETILLRVAVEDTGIGIREEDMENIFMPFEHAGETNVLRPEGAGLGLSIVKNLLDLMDSKLEVVSTPGEGSVFSFAIRQHVLKWEPLGDYSHAYKKASEHPGQRRTLLAPKAKVLVVDDTPVNLVVFKNLLQPTQIQIDTATGAREMLQMVRSRSYDLIFLDHRMPGMDGIEAFHAMRAMTKGNRNPDTPVIALTANAVMGARQMYLDEGFTDYLSKPVDSLRLEQMLTTYLPEEYIEHADPEEVTTDTESSVASGGQAAEASVYASIEGIDYEAGVTNCGSEKTLVDALKIFYETIDEKSRDIEGFAASGAVKDYTILVHALKSAARFVGALQLSEDALHLEEAGDREDLAEIEAKTPALLADYRAYKARLKPFFDGGTSDEEKPEMSEEEIAEFYETVKELSEMFDLDNLDKIIERAETFRLPAAHKETFDAVKSAVTAADWDALANTLSREL